MKKLLILALLIVGCEETLEPEDCAGVAGGTAELDCFGVCGGVAIKDDCGLCTGGTTEVIANSSKDCAGVCGGIEEEDCAGVCDGDAVEDCAGECGGDSIVDECGVCGGDGTSCYICTDATACNFDSTATIFDNSCWYANEGCECEYGQGAVVDCLGICDADPLNDPPQQNDGNCDISVIGGCIDTTKCNYNFYATHNNGSCAVDLSVFGGLPDGTDCNEECGGDAVADECGVCDGDGSTCYISYSAMIQPIFNANCTGCHGGSGGLTLDSYSNLIAGNVLISGNSTESLIIQKLKGTASGAQMPKNATALSESTINLIATWIDEGAKDN